ncbi:MAG: DUF433 domain-containing protein [Symploca sp. SIO2G7]|nr:DUF433 domain-containing protein [Symploca sp. SIO2G7]
MKQLGDPLEKYFHFYRPDDIRLKGTRVGIEHILKEYIHNGKSPEEIDSHFSTVSLEQIYATILYYLRNQEAVGKYFHQWLDYCRQAQEEHDQNPPPAVLRLLKLKEEQKAAQVVK